MVEPFYFFTFLPLKIYRRSCHNPESRLPYIAIIDIPAAEQVVAIDVDAPFVGIPRKTCVSKTVSAVIVAVVVDIEITAHAVLHPEVYSQVQSLVNIELGSSHKLVLKVLQRILAYYSLMLFLVLIQIAVGKSQLPQEPL